MVTEIAIIDTKPGSAQGFVDVFNAEGYDLLINTPDCLEASMPQSREMPTRFIGVNRWESREAHVNVTRP